jgi:hypothetical protein
MPVSADRAQANIGLPRVNPPRLTRSRGRFTERSVRKEYDCEVCDVAGHGDPDTDMCEVCA